MGNLAQVQIAFLGFIEQLERIRSLRPSAPKEISEFSTLTDNVRTATMDDIQKYVEIRGVTI
ncbi:MAG: hypothetical protein AYK19_12975 [Theionarchaea archaeon DG-70-1]|nr:MAG: hypothetical protein AYK19_12975 [Theionarchaea archaeon DG-70-1]